MGVVGVAGLMLHPVYSAIDQKLTRICQCAPVRQSGECFGVVLTLVRSLSTA